MQHYIQNEKQILKVQKQKETKQQMKGGESVDKIQEQLKYLTNI